MLHPRGCLPGQCRHLVGQSAACISRHHAGEPPAPMLIDGHATKLPAELFASPGGMGSDSDAPDIPTWR